MGSFAVLDAIRLRQGFPIGQGFRSNMFDVGVMVKHMMGCMHILDIGNIGRIVDDSIIDVDVTDIGDTGNVGWRRSPTVGADGAADYSAHQRGNQIRGKERHGAGKIHDRLRLVVAYRRVGRGS
jgi:hypothetical protein